MPKESEMNSPLGHVFRDIVKVETTNSRYVILTMSCGHVKEMTQPAYRKHHKDADNATLCMSCTNEELHKKTGRGL